MNEVLINIIETIFGGLILTFILFFLNEFVFNKKNLSGVWKVDLEIDESTFNPYKNLLIEYQFHLIQNGNSIKGTGEKIKETNKEKEVTEYERSKRVTIEIDGFYNRKYLRKSQINLNIKENGRQRESRAFYNLKVENNKKMIGSFDWTAADSTGKLTFEKI